MIRARSGPPWAALLLVAAVMFRAMIPAGWMPNPATPFAAPLVICTSEGARLANPPGAPAKHQAARPHDVCVFAAVASTPGPNLFLPAARTSAAERLDRPGIDRAEPGPASRHRDQAPRAPPEPV
ncbi:MAG TPA: hypothetical protein VFE03_14520 [Caulobacteraceae bacterium]|jgi:hypothetical protein|nr:hypothetical protein [Caulobacteraceae bacterium]